MEEEIMIFLNETIFNPILEDPNVSNSIKRRTRFTRENISRLPANSMILYFWNSIVSEGIAYSIEKRNESLPRFEDILEEFRIRFPIPSNFRK